MRLVLVLEFVLIHVALGIESAAVLGFAVTWKRFRLAAFGLLLGAAVVRAAVLAGILFLMPNPFPIWRVYTSILVAALECVGIWLVYHQVATICFIGKKNGNGRNHSHRR